ncbi:MAG: hypothetical protein K1V76_04445, partial [Candidatus Amulumruptor sp.]
NIDNINLILITTTPKMRTCHGMSLPGKNTIRQHLSMLADFFVYLGDKMMRLERFMFDIH